MLDKIHVLDRKLHHLTEAIGKVEQDEKDKQHMIHVSLSLNFSRRIIIIFVLKTLRQELEVMSIVKANKEDLEDALAEKADACAIKSKVSHEQFDTTRNELSRGIEKAFNKLTEQVFGTVQ